jgi:transposase-like protein
MATRKANNKPFGRPTKLTASTKTKLLRLIREGHYIEDAAQVCGIDDSTFRKWMIRGRNEQNGVHREFFTAVTRARADAKVSLLRKVLSGDDRGVSFGPAKAALEVLSRAYPKQFSQRVSVEIERELDVMLDTAQRVLPDEWFLKLLDALEEKGDGEEEETGEGETPPANT